MKVRKSHFVVIIFEMISLVLALASLVFFILTLIMAKENPNPALLFTDENVGAFIIFVSFFTLFFFAVPFVFFTALFSKNYRGILYTFEFQILGLLIPVSLMIMNRLGLYGYLGGTPLVLAIFTVVLAGIAFVSSLIFFITYLVDSTNVFKHKKELAKEKKAQKAALKVEKKEPKVIEETPVVEEQKEKQIKKSAPKKELKQEEKEEESEPRVMTNKVYHISQHPTTNKWQVKLAKGEKALKLFDTQAEALAYAKEVAKNQGGSIRLHSRKGKMRSA